MGLPEHVKPAEFLERRIYARIGRLRRDLGMLTRLRELQGC
jgi:hypothetical protein